jgi:hypothetical protein
MKTKKFSKKLVLSKQTIVNLGNGEMNKLKAGRTTVDLTGNPCVHCISVWPIILSICICQH